MFSLFHVHLSSSSSSFSPLLLPQNPAPLHQIRPPPSPSSSSFPLPSPSPHSLPLHQIQPHPSLNRTLTQPLAMSNSFTLTPPPPRVEPNRSLLPRRRRRPSGSVTVSVSTREVVSCRVHDVVVRGGVGGRRWG